jgi:hypothetical protein
VRPTLHNLHASLEALTLYLLSDFEALLGLRLSDTFDVKHVFLGTEELIEFMVRESE